MKHTNKFFFLFLGAILILGACNKTDNSDWEEQARLDSIRIEKAIAEQAPLLEAYVHDPANEWHNPIFKEETGIWYEVLAEGDQDSYDYKLNGNGGLVAPTIEVKYKGELLNGTVFDETDEESANKKTLTINLAQTRVIPAWQFALLPQSIYYNGQTYPLNGLTEKGLKKGSKIRFITPSPWGYDNKPTDKIPADSPLVFEIEVVNISDQ